MQVVTKYNPGDEVWAICSDISGTQFCSGMIVERIEIFIEKGGTAIHYCAGKQVVPEAEVRKSANEAMQEIKVRRAMRGAADAK